MPGYSGKPTFRCPDAGRRTMLTLGAHESFVEEDLQDMAGAIARAVERLG